MAVIYNHVQMGIVDAKGDVNVMYPLNTAEDVSLKKTTNESIPTDVETLQDLTDNIGKMAFDSGSNVVFFDSAEASESDATLSTSEIDDSKVSLASTYSSSKIMQLINEVKALISK